MDWYNLNAEKRAEQIATRADWAVKRFEQGPQLEDHGEGNIVLYWPTPQYNPKVAALLRDRGFQFHESGVKHWTRPCSRPYRGKVYSPEAWLEWARARYTWAWPDWTPPTLEEPEE